MNKTPGSQPASDTASEHTNIRVAAAAINISYLRGDVAPRNGGMMRKRWKEEEEKEMHKRGGGGRMNVIHESVEARGKWERYT